MNQNNPYSTFSPKDLILRDKLAIDRTVLSNERTILSYSRTALTLIIAGVTFIHFFDRGLLLYLGLIFVPSGIAIAIFGFGRYLRMDRSIRHLRSAFSFQTPPTNGKTKSSDADGL